MMLVQCITSSSDVSLSVLRLSTALLNTLAAAPKKHAMTSYPSVTPASRILSSDCDLTTYNLKI